MLILSGGPILPEPTNSWDAGYCLNPRAGFYSLRRHISDFIDDKLISTNPSTQTLAYANWQDNGSSVTRNSSCWINSSYLMSIPVWNTTLQSHGNGSLISPRHIVCATHYSPNIGDAVKFIEPDNTVFETNIESRIAVNIDLNQYGMNSVYSTDVTIAKLSENVPSVFTFARIMPNNWLSYMPNLGYSQPRVPVFNLDRFRRYRVFDLGAVTVRQVNSYIGRINLAKPTNAQRLNYYYDAIAGDSGGAIMTIVNGLPVVLTTLHTGLYSGAGAGAGPNLVDYKNEINNAMATLGGGYQLTEIDLSGFNFYG